MAFYKERTNGIEIIIPVSDMDALTGSEIKEYISKIIGEITAVIINFQG